MTTRLVGSCRGLVSSAVCVPSVCSSPSLAVDSSSTEDAERHTTTFAPPGVHEVQNGIEHSSSYLTTTTKPVAA